MAGSYEALSGGQTGDALVDFTGGVNEAIDIREGGYQGDDLKQQELFVKMDHGHKHKSLISCSIAVSAHIVLLHVPVEMCSAQCTCTCTCT